MRWLTITLVTNLVLFLLYLFMSIRISEMYDRFNLAYTPPFWKSPYLLTFGLFSLLSMAAWIYFRRQVKLQNTKGFLRIKVVAGILSLPWIYVLLSQVMYYVWISLFLFLSNLSF
jgi:hypothetical protein